MFTVTSCLTVGLELGLALGLVLVSGDVFACICTSLIVIVTLPF